MDKIRHIIPENEMKVSQLVDQMKNAGFGARNLGKASDILKEMLKDKDCRIFLGIAGAMVPAGMKRIIIDMINTGRISAVVTTGATLTHDMIEALGESHYQCDSWDDRDFQDKGYDRMHNVFMKKGVYEILEKFFKENWQKLNETRNVASFLRKIGEILPKEEKSILKTCHDRNIPVFCPGIADSGIGLMIWGRLMEGKKISVDVFDDMNDIIDLAWTSGKNGVLYIGGGVPKNFIQQSLQFSKGADYGIQITTDRAESGGSSGAPLAEGISWGKMNKKGKFVDVFCDATIALPLLWMSVR
ncbi:MAG: deoxyhypusine synthase [Nanoarchaeota archaeon]